METTPGVDSARPLSSEEQSDLLTPWLGVDVPFDKLPLPRLIEIVQTPDGFDPQGLRLRLTGELPSAVLDDHVRWRRPLVQAANWLSVLGMVAIGLIGLISSAMIILAARAALASNAQVITVLRLIGATDAYIEAAFVRRFAFRTFIGAVVGTIIGTGIIMLLPGEEEQVAIVTGLRLSGVEWIWLVLIPPILSSIAFSATRYTANRVLNGLT